MTAATINRADLAFRVEPKPFAAACTWVAKRIPAKPTIPHLACILIELADGQLTLSVFDYEVSARATLDVTGDSDGRALVSGRLLAELAKTFPNKPVTAAIDGNHLAVTCGTVKLRLPLMPVEDYPALPDQPPTVGTIDADTFSTAIGRVAPAVDPGSPVPALTGIHLRIDGDTIDIEGTDRFRAAIATCNWRPVDPGINTAALVPATVLADTAKTFDGGAVTVGFDGDGLIGFTTTGRSITVRTIAEVYPKVASLFPSRGEQPTVVQVADLAAALKRALLVRERATPVRLAFTAESVTALASDGHDASVAEPIDCQHHGPDITVAFNPEYLLDGLACLHADTVELHMTDAKKPVLVTAPDDTNYRHLVVPIRLEGTA